MHTLLFSDIVDSTAVVQRLGDAAAADLWTRHDRGARELLARHRGREIDRSDGFFLLFDEVAPAAAYAREYHALLASLGLAARVGLHCGEVTLRTNEPDAVALGAKPLEVDGLAKPLAARVMSLAAGGQTLLTADAAQALGPVSPAAEVHRHGHWRLKGLAEPVEIVEVAAPGHPPRPPTDGEKAYRVVWRDGLWLPRREIPNNLPPERDAFVGRAADLARVAERLAGGARLVTVHGTAGAGKTRLVRRYARAWLGDWGGGVTFCDLSEARTRDGMCLALAAALGVPLAAHDAVTQLGHAIAARGRHLVILDNFEQLVAHAEATLGPWLDRAGEAAFLVTSRERLGLAGEQVLLLEPMDAEGDAITLFAERARAQLEGFTLDEPTRRDVAAVVAQLDGLPLAIELAAARVAVLSPAQIAARLRDRFTMLRHPGATGPARRQAALEAAIDWSWALLQPWEQAALAQCSVFDGGFTLEAAEQVIDVGTWPEAPPVMDVVQSLVDKSLLRAWTPQGHPRRHIEEPFFGLFLSIQDYARAKLRAAGEAVCTEAERRHGRCFARRGSVEAIDALMLEGGWRRRRVLADELDNVVTACRRAAARGDGEVAADCLAASWAVFDAQGPYGLAVEIARTVTALAGLSPLRRARTHHVLAMALGAVGRRDESNGETGIALTAAREAGDPRVLALVLRNAAIDLGRLGRTDEALAAFDEVLALSRRQGLRLHEAVTLANRANFYMERSRFEDARADYEAALALYRALGSTAALGITLGNLGTLDHELGRHDTAAASYEAALQIHRETGSLTQQAITLANLALLRTTQGALDEAEALNAEALDILRRTGNRRSVGVVTGQVAALRRLRGDVAGALALYEEALAVHREVGNRRFEAGTLGHIGDILVERGRAAEAGPYIDRGVALLRELGDRLSLAAVLCIRGIAAAATGDRAQALDALHEAETLAEAVGALPESETGRAIAQLRDRLAGPVPPG